MQMRRADLGWLRTLGAVASIGLLILIATMIGLAFGVWLDKLFGTSPWLTFLFTLLGLAAGLVESAKILMKVGQ